LRPVTMVEQLLYLELTRLRAVGESLVSSQTGQDYLLGIVDSSAQG
jgi:hypothetical protein